MRENEVMEESRHLGEYERAVRLLADVAGDAAAARADRARSSVNRGLWALQSRSGKLLGEVNIFDGTVLVHAVPVMRVARIVSIRVVCDCGAPKVLTGTPRPGGSYQCGQCEALVFVGESS